MTIPDTGLLFSQRIIKYFPTRGVFFWAVIKFPAFPLSLSPSFLTQFCECNLKFSSLEVAFVRNEMWIRGSGSRKVACVRFPGLALRSLFFSREPKGEENWRPFQPRWKCKKSSSPAWGLRSLFFLIINFFSLSWVLSLSRGFFLFSRFLIAFWL